MNRSKLIIILPPVITGLLSITLGLAAINNNANDIFAAVYFTIALYSLALSFYSYKIID